MSRLSDRERAGRLLVGVLAILAAAALVLIFIGTAANVPGCAWEMQRVQGGCG